MTPVIRRRDGRRDPGCQPWLRPGGHATRRRCKGSSTRNGLLRAGRMRIRPAAPGGSNSLWCHIGRESRCAGGAGVGALSGATMLAVKLAPPATATVAQPGPGPPPNQRNRVTGSSAIAYPCGGCQRNTIANGARVWRVRARRYTNSRWCSHRKHAHELEHDAGGPNEPLAPGSGCESRRLSKCGDRRSRGCEREGDGCGAHGGSRR